MRAGGADEKPEYKRWDPNVAQLQTYPITTYQPIYFVADSLVGTKRGRGT
jgi:phenylalanine-4-hydroxylase